MTTLDVTIDEDVYVLKVDVQGWEPHVFAGATNLLSTRNVTIVGAPQDCPSHLLSSCHALNC